MSRRQMMRVWCLVLSGWTTVAQADEQSATAEIEKLGGSVRVIAQNTTQKEVAFHLSSQEITDTALLPLKEISDIVWLNLRGTKITDEGLKSLANLKSLTTLHLEKTAITDAGLVQLAGLENLEYLNLYGAKVTDAGLEPLKNLKKLKKLYVWQTEVTKQGADQLAQAVPGVYVNRGADAEPTPPTQTYAQGRYVKVRLEGEKRILSLAEVQILETGSGKELQQAGTALQSSTYESAAADRAKDGNVDGAFASGSVSHTNEQSNPWWLLDLGEVKDIGKLVLHNRADCCGDRLKDAIVEVFDVSLSVVKSDKLTEVADGSVSELMVK